MTAPTARRRPSGPTCSPTRWPTRPSPSRRVDWRPPMAGTEADLAARGRRPAARATPTRRALAAMLGVAGRPSSTWPRRARCSASSRASSCTPGRRSTGTGPAGPLRGRADGRRCARGPRRRPRGRRRACSRPAPRSSSSPATTGARSARWPAWSSPSMWMCVLEDPAHRRRARTARSTRASARCCGTAPTVPRCSSGWRGCATCSGRCCRPPSARAADGPVDVTGILDARCCRWATRPTTATAPAR